jgi:hypothetical protein
MISNRQAGTISSHRLSYDEAFLYCITSNENGYKDWGLPTQNEARKLSSTLVWYNDDVYKDIIDYQCYAIPVRTV